MTADISEQNLFCLKEGPDGLPTSNNEFIIMQF